MNETLDQQRQLALETQAAQEGIARYRQQELRLRETGQAGSTDWGNTLVHRAIAPMVEALNALTDASATKAGRRHAMTALFEYLPIDLIAFVTARTVIDDIFRLTGTSLAPTSLHIADFLLTEAQAKDFEEGESKLFKTVADRLRRNPMGNNPNVRTSTLRHAAKKFNVTISAWPKTTRAQVGRTLLELFVNSTGLVSIVKTRVGRKITEHLEPSETLLEWITNFKDRSELLRPNMTPMLVPPKPWTTIDDGGYLELKTYHRGLVKTRTKGYREELIRSDLSSVFSAVNALQETSWRVNKFVYDAADACCERGIEVGDTLVGDDAPLPPKPPENADKAQWAAWKAQAGEIFRCNKQNQGRKIQAVRTLFVADKFKDEYAIYFPYQLDFRGRVYSLPSFLNPQGNDLSKGLLTFSGGKPLGASGAYWLFVHAANCYGVDKVSYEDRVAWVEEHRPFILAIAQDPLCDLWWTAADNPWQFLAACKAIEGFVEQGTDYCCSLPISVDGSNNGLQHFSAMLRDESCGLLVNLVPGDKPQDIYQAVADRVIVELEKRKGEDDLAYLWLRFGITRKVCKRPVMIIPYGGQKDGIRGYIIKSIDERKDHPFSQRVGEAAGYLRDIMWDVMNDLMPGPREAMKWLQEAAKEITKVNKPVTWAVPSGFIAQQAYYAPNTKVVQVFVLGRRLALTVQVGQKSALDRKKQVQAFSPNFVHSLDASALIGTVNRAFAQGLTHFACVHDSYGTHACDVELLQHSIRAVFVEHYSGDVLGDLKAQIDQLLPAPFRDPPAMGQLQIAPIAESDYFFS